MLFDYNFTINMYIYFEFKNTMYKVEIILQYTCSSMTCIIHVHFIHVFLKYILQEVDIGY